MRFVIYVEDHQPAHVHVIGNGMAKIAFETATATLEHSKGCPNVISNELST